MNESRQQVLFDVDTNKNVCVSWFSGGVTSAVTCKLIADMYGLSNCRFIFIDTKNEGQDTYRFKRDCERWLGKEIETYSAIPEKYKSIEDVWRRYLSLNVATGAICSTELKQKVRKDFEKNEHYDAQAFGFSIEEPKRARAMANNYTDASPIFPLLFYGMSKKDCVRMVEDAGIELPWAYRVGFQNNNCLNTGCVQGGIGYWQKIRREFPEKFEKMAAMEHELTDRKGQPVTICRDKSKDAKESGVELVFLKKHPDYPQHKELLDMKGREPEPLTECNGTCGTTDNQ